MGWIVSHRNCAKAFRQKIPINGLLAGKGMHLMFIDAELERYSRQLSLPSIDLEGQAKLKMARIAIVGIGGLGATVAMMLTGSGIGQIKLIDGDRIELSNLQRQVLFRETDIGRKKVVAAQWHLSHLNSHIQFNSEANNINSENIDRILSGMELIIDCTDNVESRQLINHYCVLNNINLIQGSACQMSGEVINLPLSQPDCACYECLYPDLARARADACARSGIFAPLLSIIGGLQAQLAIHTITLGAPPVGTVYRYDASQVQFRTFNLPPKSECNCCGHGSNQPQRKLLSA